jgi:hypothetical protein
MEDNQESTNEINQESKQENGQENNQENNEEENQDQLLLKQELLKSEIVAKNYDGNKFLQFCLNKKENGDDMNNWTYDELKQCVDDFIESQKQKDKNKENQNDENNKEKEEEKKENKIIQEEKVDIEHNEYIVIKHEEEKKDNDFCLNKIHEIPTKLLEKSILSNKEIKVTIKNPKTNEKRLSQTYVTYEVLTEPSCWSVRRRYSDFTLLRQILYKYFPRLLIPPLPEKKIGNKRFKPDFIERRMKFLQLFMNDVIKNESFKSNEALTIFLNFNDHSQFEKKMKELNNYTYPSNFDDTKSVLGKVNTLENDYSCDTYLTNIFNFFKAQKQIFLKLNSALKSYCRLIASACQNLEEIAKSFEELHNLNANIEIKEEITKTYNILSYFFKEKRVKMSKENEYIHEKIKGFFKLQRLKNNSFIDICEIRENLKQKYNNENNKLYAKKEKLYSVKDINKWEIANIEKIDKPLLLRDKNYAFENMCQKDSLYVNNLYKHLTYENYVVFSEFKNMLDINVKAYIGNTKDFAKLIEPFYSDAKNHWEKLNSYI